MPRLSAFVGHSFAEIDQPVVNALLGMLNTIRKAMPDFEWDHALEAEPKVLSQKVKEKMEGKNLFIGICTAKEMVVEPSAVKQLGWFRRDKLTAPANTFQRKTSDWVIQEIGMAVGRGMSLVLLIEDGVRVPGGLQGDLEYIPFSRHHPEKCLDKVVDMLSALAPPIAAAARETQAPSVSGDMTSFEQAAEDSSGLPAPDASWTGDRYANAYFVAITVKDDSYARQIADAFAKSELSKDQIWQAAFQASAISARAEAAGEPWVEPLKKLAMQYPDAAGPHAHLARRFAAAGDHAQAALRYTQAASLSRTPLGKVRLSLRAAEQSHKAHQQNHVRQCLDLATGIVRENAGIEADAMVAFANFWKDSADMPMFTFCAERALELTPDQASPRFDLAYAYGEADHEPLALFHYRQYLAIRSDDAAALNNVGVTASANRLPIASVEAYRRADELGNTIATSNLVNALIDAGFLSDALSLCEKGLQHEQPDSSLIESKVRCERVRSEENDQEAKILQSTELRRSIARKLGRASVAAPIESLASNWDGPDCKLTAVLANRVLTLKGIYARQSNALIFGPGLATPSQVEVMYEGKLIGRAFLGRAKKEAGAKSLLGADESEVVGVVNDDGTCIELFEDFKEGRTIVATG